MALIRPLNPKPEAFNQGSNKAYAFTRGNPVLRAQLDLTKEACKEQNCPL